MTNNLKTMIPKMVNNVLLFPNKEIINHNYIISLLMTLLTRCLPTNLPPLVTTILNLLYHSTTGTQHTFPNP